MWMRRRCHCKNHVTGSAKYCNTLLGFVMVASCCSCGSRHRGGSRRNCVASKVPMGGFRSGLQVGIVGSGNFNALTLLSRLFRWDYLLGIDTFCWPGILFTVLNFWLHYWAGVWVFMIHCHQSRQDLWQCLAITRPPLWCHHTCHFLVQKYFGFFSDHFNLKFLMILRFI